MLKQSTNYKKGYMMEITENNIELVTIFIQIMKNIGISREASGMITAMLQNTTQMDELVEYIHDNPKVTEAELIGKAAKICGLIET